MRPGLRQLFEKLVADSKRYQADLPPELLDKILDYQEASSINEWLRKGLMGRAPQNKWEERLQSDAATLDEIIQNAPRTPEPFSVYRGAPEGVYPGVDEGYLSTSFDPTMAREFANAIKDQTTLGSKNYKILVPEETPYLAPHDLVPEYADQQELIFPRGATISPFGGQLMYRRGKFAGGGLAMYAR